MANQNALTAAHIRYLLVLLGEPNRKLENGSQQIYQDAAAACRKRTHPLRRSGGGTRAFSTQRP